MTTDHCHQRGDNCTPPQTAEPDTTVQASAPPAVTEDEPTPPADTPATCLAWTLDEYDVRHTCDKPAGHDGLHRCYGDATAPSRRCGTIWADPEPDIVEKEVPGVIDIDVRWLAVAGDDDLDSRCNRRALAGGEAHQCGLPFAHSGAHKCSIDTDMHHDCGYRWHGPAMDGWEDELFETDAPAERNIVTPDAGIAPLSPAEQAQASDMALVSDAVLALTMLDDQCPDPVRPLLAAARAAAEVARWLRGIADQLKRGEL